MSNQIVITDIDALVSELCEDFPNALRQLAAAIEAGRMTGRYRDHVAHGMTARGFGLRVTFDLHGDVVAAERAPILLEGAE